MRKSSSPRSGIDPRMQQLELRSRLRSSTRYCVVLAALVLLGGCSLFSTPQPPDDPLTPATGQSFHRLEESWGPGEFVGLATGTFTSKDRNFAVRRAVAGASR